MFNPKHIPPCDPRFVLPPSIFFLFLKKTLDSRLTLREACRICATVTGFVAIANGRQGAAGGKTTTGTTTTATLSSSRPGEETGLSGQSQENDQEEALLSIGDDSMGPEEFARAVYYCGDLKTWDGMCPVSQVSMSQHVCVLQGQARMMRTMHHHRHE